MRLGELSDDIYNRLDSEVTMKVTILNVPLCVNNTLQYFVLVALNHLNIKKRIQIIISGMESTQLRYHYL
jgi:hypothetical protein